jgi:hypothetical protein
MTTRYARSKALQRVIQRQEPVSQRHPGTEHLPKNSRASEQPGSFNVVAWAHVDASIALWVGTGVMFLSLRLGITHFPVLGTDSLWIFFLAFALILVLAASVIVGVTLSIRMLRVDLFTPRQMTMVFNRRTRKVYRFVQDMPTRDGSGPWRIFKYWFGAFAPWPIVLVEYEWDCVEAEYYKTMTMVGKTPKQIHGLSLYVKASPSSDEVIDGFNLGTPLDSSEQTVRRQWEWIRRFMEEGGPPVYPGDTPVEPANQGWIKAAGGMPGVLVTFMALAGVVSLLIWWWRDWEVKGFYDLMFRSLWPLTILGSICLPWIFFSWLSYYTAPNVDEAPELRRDAGEPVDVCVMAAALQSRSKVSTV